MSVDEMTVTIPLDRYENLLDTETRENVLHDYLKRNSYAKREEILRILGHPGDADKIREQEEEDRKAYLATCTGVGGTKDAGTD